MKFKNVKEKMQFISQLEKMNSQSIQEIIPIISRLSKDKNNDVKIALAEQLQLFDCEQVEDILCDMLSDKNRMVRLEALDSVSFGGKEETIEKVSTMLVGEGYLIRMYAVTTLFELIINVYGMCEKAFEKYREIINKSYREEANQRVLVAYFENEYYMNKEKGLSLLKDIYYKTIEERKHDVIWTILHVFRDVRNEDNQIELQQILNYRLEELLPVQQKFVNEKVLNL